MAFKVAFNHRTLKPITLSDGSYIPASSQIAVPSAAILCDPEIVSKPEKFDALRAYRARLKPGESHRNQFGQMSKTHMHFGYGRHACPGRTLAANEIKLITAALLLHFDFRQVEGKSRPRNIMLDEFVFTEPGTNLLVRRRTVRDGVGRLAV
jgi:cytochrome P450